MSNNSTTDSRLSLMKEIGRLMKERIRPALEERGMELKAGGELTNRFISEESTFSSWAEVQSSSSEASTEVMRKIVRYLSGDVILLDMAMLSSKAPVEPVVKPKAKNVTPPVPPKPVAKDADPLPAPVEDVAPARPARSVQAEGGLSKEQQLASLIRDLAAGSAPVQRPVAELDYARVEKMIADAVEQARYPSMIDIVDRRNGGNDTISVGLSHYKFPLVLRLVEAGIPVFLTGPAGSFKTSLGHQVAKALSIPFEPQSFCQHTTKSDLFGFVDVQGKYQSSPLYRCFTGGGLWLGDEFDAGNPSVSLAMNSVLANGHCGFPNGLKEVHKDFRVIVTGNTIYGATDQYVGRNKPDAATMDRFAVVDISYDPMMEAALVGAKPKIKIDLDIEAGGTDVTAQEWMDYVQDIREKVRLSGVNLVVSSRAIILGWKALQYGIGRTHVENALIWRGLNEEQRNRVMKGGRS